MTSQSDVFDVIIVGGGTAGLVVANRLSEDSNLQVLVIEAGANKNGDPKITVPMFMQQCWGNPELDWLYETVPQEGFNGRVIAQPRGKVLGGTSCINALLAMYPSKQLFDLWSNLGNEGWDWQGISPYYKKFQTYNPAPPELESTLGLGNFMDYGLYGTEGPIQTSTSKYILPMHDYWLKTTENLGYPMNTDPRSGIVTGAMFHSSLLDPKGARRSHAGVAYWEPIASRPNVHLVENALAEKVLLSKTDGQKVTATGVQYRVGGERRTAYAKREVVLSAGAANTPALLEMSGIGNPEILNPLGIDILVNNPNVGENLQDHVMVSSCLEVGEKDSLDALFRDPKNVEAAIQEYMQHQTGPFSLAFNFGLWTPVVNLTSTPQGKDELENLFSRHLGSEYVSKLSKGQQIQVEWIMSTLRDPLYATLYYSALPADLDVEQTLSRKGLNAATIPTTYLQPFSRGSIHIKSIDPAVAPLIDPRYLSQPIDLELLGHGMMFAADVMRSPPLSNIFKEGGQRLPPSSPGYTIDEAKAFAKEKGTTQFHMCGTCAMMSEDMGGVVNDRCVVYGTNNLRVVDASFFPAIPNCPFTTTVYATAEKAADLIKEELQKH